MAAPQAQFLHRFFAISICVSILYTAFFHYRFQQHSISLENNHNDNAGSIFKAVDHDEIDQRKRAAILARQSQKQTIKLTMAIPTNASIISPTASPRQPTIITSQNQTSATTTPENIKYWRFDEASPKIQKAKTLFLQSIPLIHRLPTDGSTHNMTEYASHPQNRFPQKLHLFETNPCIAVLPQRYRTMFAVGDTQPVYITVYRVTHKNNCYHGSINLQILGGTWDPTESDYLGVTLLDSHMNIIHETVVSLLPPSPASIIISHDDYRIFNLQDELYLTSMHKIVPLYLDTNDGAGDNNSLNKTAIEVPPAFPNNIQSFKVYLRIYSACAVYYSREFRQKGDSKNLLYFVSHDKPSNASATSIATTQNNYIRMLHYPRYNPNDVRAVELNTKCGRQPITPYRDRHKTEWYPDASFRTIDEAMFPHDRLAAPLWLRDRGSACCTEMVDPNGTTVLVAVVHPKTMFPGRKLPPGVAPNIYLSRWIAFEPTVPYRIVARSGMFCLGYPNDMDGLGNVMNYNGTGKYVNPLATTHMNPLNFAGVHHKCPRIHFVMGMVDEVDDIDSVLISYGVSDCLSRIVEVRKEVIYGMMWPSTKS